MYNESVKKAVLKYQSKFKKVQLLVPMNINEVIEKNESNKQSYIMGLIKNDLAARGLLNENDSIKEDSVSDE